MILKIDNTTFFFIEFNSKLSAGFSINDQLRKQLIYICLFDDIIIQLPKLHLTQYKSISFNFNHTVTSITNISTLYLCLFKLNKKFSLSRVD